MYATTPAALDDAEQAMDEWGYDDETDAASRYKTRVTKFLERGDEWLMIRRQNTWTRGNNTNNYSEATVRIMKDIILQRAKAFNVVALVDFCCTVLETYIKKRLLSFAYGRRASPRLQYSELCEKMKSVDKNCVREIDEYRFLVPSQSRTHVLYTVDADCRVWALCLSRWNEWQFLQAPGFHSQGVQHTVPKCTSRIHRGSTFPGYCGTR